MERFVRNRIAGLITSILIVHKDKKTAADREIGGCDSSVRLSKR
jgi:ribosomal protein S17E